VDCLAGPFALLESATLPLARRSAGWSSGSPGRRQRDQEGAIHDTTGGDGIIVEPGGEIIDSYVFGGTIGVYGVAVSTTISNGGETVFSGGLDSGSTVIGDMVVSSGGETIGVTFIGGTE
jgi:hypothetical protein